MQLRPYQLDALPLLRASIRKHKRIVYVLPTGGGKTVIFSELIRVAVDKGSTVLAITDRIELFTQTFDAITATSSMIAPQVIHAKSKIFDKRAPCTVAMVETLARRFKSGLLDGYQPNLIIIDECHKGNFTKIMDAFPDVCTIGFTATPIGKHLVKYYTDIVQHIDIPELIYGKPDGMGVMSGGGHLLPCKSFQMQDDFDDVKVVRGEYDSDQLFKHFNTSKLYSGVVDKYKEKLILPSGERIKTLVFNVNIEHAYNMNDEFNSAGIRSEVVTSKTKPEERVRILKDFKAGRFDVLQNCSILTTGYDEPSIGAIIINRATKSLALWLQMNGRGSRPYTSPPGLMGGVVMKEFICLDFGMNHNEHGLWSEPRKWSLTAPKKRKKKDVAPVKECPTCSAMIHASIPVCPHCGYEYPIKLEEDRNGVLVEIKTGLPKGMAGKKLSELNVVELRELQLLRRLKGPMVWRLVRALGEEQIRVYAGLMGYRDEWVRRQIVYLIDNVTEGEGGKVQTMDYVLT